MKVWREEVFGPVMTLTKFKTLDEVVARANDSPYGLACGIFTKDARKGHDLSRRIRAGLVFWNCYHVVDVAAPFGMTHTYISALRELHVANMDVYRWLQAIRFRS